MSSRSLVQHLLRCRVVIIRCVGGCAGDQPPCAGQRQDHGTYGFTQGNAPVCRHVTVPCRLWTKSADASWRRLFRSSRSRVPPRGVAPGNPVCVSARRSNRQSASRFGSGSIPVQLSFSISVRRSRGFRSICRSPLKPGHRPERCETRQRSPRISVSRHTPHECSTLQSHAAPGQDAAEGSLGRPARHEPICVFCVLCGSTFLASPPLPNDDPRAARPSATAAVSKVFNRKQRKERKWAGDRAGTERGIRFADAGRRTQRSVCAERQWRALNSLDGTASKPE